MKRIRLNIMNMSAKENKKLTVYDTPLYQWLNDQPLKKEYILFDVLTEWLETLGYSRKDYSLSQDFIDTSDIVVQYYAKINKIPYHQIKLKR